MICWGLSGNWLQVEGIRGHTPAYDHGDAITDETHFSGLKSGQGSLPLLSPRVEGLPGERYSALSVIATDRISLVANRWLV
ncbi:hypothetical protein X740_11085 [Mesorhizobium sp. LNHC221B00]|nr:hypothetical protein X740_11085 [Mesorhizobium sp. LNHC221B00]